MYPTNLQLFLIFYLPLYILTHTGLFLLFKKAKVNHAWMAFLPLLCYIPWIKLTGRPKHWIVWCILPISDVIVWYTLVIDMLESFGKNKFWEQFQGVLFPFYYYIKMALDKSCTYLGQSRDIEIRSKIVPKKTTKREWADALFFAFIVAYLIRMFQMEPYKIPTSSMEDSMLVGDYLFVSKMNYGPRVPMTPIAFPLFHQDFYGTKTYSDAIHFPYMRLPGFQKLKRNDAVVFNVPWDQLDKTVRAPDKMQNYVKRCVGVPGDKLEIKNGILYINDEIAFQSPKLQHQYYIRFKTISPTREELTKNYDIYDMYQLEPFTWAMSVCKDDIEKLKNDYEVESVVQNINPIGGHHFFEPKMRKEYNAFIKLKTGSKLSDQDLKDLNIAYVYPLNNKLDSLFVMMDNQLIKNYKNNGKIDTIRQLKQNNGQGTDAFPQNLDIFPYNKDHYGPVYLPKRGEKVKIDAKNFYFYKRAIELYEKNPSFELRGSTPYLNGKEITEYEFKMDYYWMMGDNRDNSLDSRFWGYVPEDHIVGKPLFVFLSIQYENTEKGQKFVKVRWNRCFHLIK